MDASATPPPAVEGSGDRINARTSEGEAQVAQGMGVSLPLFSRSSRSSRSSSPVSQISLKLKH